MRERVRGMFHHAFDNYMDIAFPADELKPISCQPRNRSTEARGHLVRLTNGIKCITFSSDIAFFLFYIFRMMYWVTIRSHWLTQWTRSL